MNLSEKYKKLKELKWCMRFKTCHPDKDNYDGIVTHIHNRFIVLREERDIVFDGVVILPKKVIKGCRDNKIEKCYNQVLRHSGNIKNATAPKWLDHCTTLKDVLTTLKKKNIWPAIEIIFQEKRKKETDFYIGMISRIEKETFWIYDYSASGKWQGEWGIGYDEIFKIEFDDTYSRTFNEYMKGRLPKGRIEKMD